MNNIKKLNAINKYVPNKNKNFLKPTEYKFMMLLFVEQLIDSYPDTNAPTKVLVTKRRTKPKAVMVAAFNSKNSRMSSIWVKLAKGIKVNANAPSSKRTGIHNVKR